MFGARGCLFRLAGVITMLHGAGPAVGRAAAAIPVTFLMFFIGLLWLLGLPCDKDRSEYVEKISGQAMLAVSAIWGAQRQLTSPRPGISRQP